MIEEMQSFPARLKPLELTMTTGQRKIYHDTCKAVERELAADPKRPFVLRDGHRLFVAERVITNKAVDFNEAVCCYTPNPHTPKVLKE